MTLFNESSVLIYAQNLTKVIISQCKNTLHANSTAKYVSVPESHKKVNTCIWRNQWQQELISECSQGLEYIQMTIETLKLLLFKI